MVQLQTTHGIIKTKRQNDDLINFLYIRTALIIFLVAAFLSACAGSGSNSGPSPSKGDSFLGEGEDNRSGDSSLDEGEDNRSGELLNGTALQVNLTLSGNLLVYNPISKVEVVVHSSNSTDDLMRFPFPLAADAFHDTKHLLLGLGNFSFGEYIIEATIFHFDGRPMLRQATIFDLPNNTTMRELPTSPPNITDGHATDVNTTDGSAIGVNTIDRRTIVGSAIDGSPIYASAIDNGTSPQSIDSFNRTALRNSISTVTLSFNSSAALFDLSTSLLNLYDSDDDGHLEVFHPIQLAALANQELNVEEQLRASYELIADIDLSDYSNWYPIGSRDNYFRGSLEGNGFSVSGLTSQGYNVSGLFGYMQNTIINNLSIQVDNIEANQGAGALAGIVLDSQISNIEVMLGDIQSSGIPPFNSVRIGGFVGEGRRNNFSNISIRGSGSISVNSLENRRITLKTGVFAGELSSSEVTDVTITGDFDISADSSIGPSHSLVGGFVGELLSSSLSDVAMHINGTIASYAIKNDTAVKTELGLISGDFQSGSAINVNASITSQFDNAISIINPGFYDVGILAGDASAITFLNVNASIDGNILMNSDDYGEGDFAFAIADGGIHQVSDTNIVIDGDIILATNYPSVSSFIVESNLNRPGVNNTSIILNGDISMGKGGSMEMAASEYASVAFSGLCRYICPAIINNTSLVINGDLSIYTNNKSMYLSTMFDDYDERTLYQISQSSVLINGSISLDLYEADLYFSAIGLDNYAGPYDLDQSLSINNSYAHITGDTIIDAVFADDGDNRINLGMFHKIGEHTISVNLTDSYIAMDESVEVYINNALAAPDTIYFNTSVASDHPTYAIASEGFYHNARLLGPSGTSSSDSLLAADPNYRDYVQLLCPTGPTQSCGDLPNDKFTYTNWDESIWDFGNSATLPLLRRRHQ